jgi:hypothetical protein
LSRLLVCPGCQFVNIANLSCWLVILIGTFARYIFGKHFWLVFLPDIGYVMDIVFCQLNYV